MSQITKAPLTQVDLARAAGYMPPVLAQRSIAQSSAAIESCLFLGYLAARTCFSVAACDILLRPSCNSRYSSGYNVLTNSLSSIVPPESCTSMHPDVAVGLRCPRLLVDQLEQFRDLFIFKADIHLVEPRSGHGKWSPTKSKIQLQPCSRTLNSGKSICRGRGRGLHKLSS